MFISEYMITCFSLNCFTDSNLDPMPILFKGDFTRTGERKISGMMKDGVNSANRLMIPKIHIFLRDVPYRFHANLNTKHV